MIIGATYPLLLLTNLIAGGSFHDFSRGLLIGSLVLFFIGGTLDYECKRKITAGKGDKQN